MKSLSLLFLSVFLVSCSNADRKISCTAWEHPTVGFLSGAFDPSGNHVNKNIRVVLNKTAELQVEPAWSEEKLKANGFAGNKMGVSSVEIPEAGDYIVWINKKAFVSVTEFKGLDSKNSARSLPAKRYMEDCEAQAGNGGFLRAVEFSFEKGSYRLQFSHTEGTVLIFQVTMTPG